MVGRCVIRVEGDGAVEISHGTVNIALARFDSAPHMVGRCVIRVEGDGAVEIGNGTVNIAIAPFGNAPVAVGHCVIGVEGDGAVVIGDGSVVVAGIQPSVAGRNQVLRLSAGGIGVESWL